VAIVGLSLLGAMCCQSSESGEKFSDGRFGGFTEHLQNTGCKRCAAFLVFLMRLELINKYVKTHRN
jgi:hypothetical protein